MKMRKLVVLFALVALSATVMTGCSSGQKETAAADATPEATAETTAKETDSETTTAEEAMAEENTAEEDEEGYDTGDASLDNTRNQGGISKNELLVASFDTSYNDNRRLTMGAIEDAIEKVFPDYSVRRGFTNQIIIDHVKSRNQVFTDNVGEALDRVVDNKVKSLVIQSTHLVNRLEYTSLVNEVTEYPDTFEKVVVGEPLLTTDDDLEAVIKVITEATAEYDDGKTAICFMGHGTEAESDQVHSKIQDILTDAGYNNYYMGTVETSPTVEDVLATVQTGGYRKVVLEPLIIVAGGHANNDMAGGEEGSWEKTFKDAGCEMTCLIRGLEKVEAIQQLFVEHTKAVVESLSK